MPEPIPAPAAPLPVYHPSIWCPVKTPAEVEAERAAVERQLNQPFGAPA